MATAEGSVQAASGGSDTQPRPRRARWRRSHRVGFPALALVVIFAACFLLPIVADLPPPVGGGVQDANLPLFSPGHVLGTDLNGNDMLSRLLHGGRTSLLISVVVNFIGLVVGGFVGSLGAYLKGAADSVVTRAVDLLIAFPPLVLVITIAQALGSSGTNTIVALAIFSIPAFTRVARASTLRICERPFITAARLCGTKTPRILLFHIAPNVLPQLVAFALLGIGVVITIEGALSFLGLGIQRPHPSWGNMIFDGQQALLTRPALALLPGGVLFFTVLSFNLLGEALRARWSKQ